VTKKIKILLGIIAVLILFIAASLYESPAGGRGEAAMRFALGDTLQIDSIRLGNQLIVRQGALWMLNNRYEADAPLVRQLLSVMTRMEVKKEVALPMQDTARAILQTQGWPVQVSRGKHTLLNFRVASFRDETIASDASDQPVSVLHVPGYQIFLHEIFAMPEGELRNKTITSAGWPGIRSISIRYPEKPENNVSLKQSGDFYSVEGIDANLDSLMLYNYLEAYRNMRVYAYETRSGLADSLQKLQPFCYLSMTDLVEERSISLQIYAGANKLYALSNRHPEVLILEPRYFTRFFVRRKDFVILSGKLQNETQALKYIL
jgi:hypothetical protein